MPCNKDKAWIFNMAGFYISTSPVSLKWTIYMYIHVNKYMPSATVINAVMSSTRIFIFHLISTSGLYAKLLIWWLLNQTKRLHRSF